MGRSNLAFKKVFSLPPGAHGRHLISLPYDYQPEDSNASGTIDAQDLLSDMTGAITVFRFDTATDTLIGFTTGGYDTPFPLVKGQAYELINAGAETINFVCVGAHDDSFQFSLPYSGSDNNIHWISLPYHLNLPDANANNQIDAQDVCANIGGAAFLVKMLNLTTGSFTTWTCGSIFGSPFQLEIGLGYAVVNNTNKDIFWKPPVY